MLSILMLLADSVIGLFDGLNDGKGGWDQAPDDGKGGWDAMDPGKAGW
jgi:hypothetical protein